MRSVVFKGLCYGIPISVVLWLLIFVIFSCFVSAQLKNVSPELTPTAPILKDVTEAPVCSEITDSDLSSDDALVVVKEGCR